MIRSLPSGSAFLPTETMLPFRTTTSPSTMSSRSFIVTIVALRMMMAGESEAEREAGESGESPIIQP
jgi:hypothetical protein